MVYFVRNLSFWRGERNQAKTAQEKKFPNKILEFVRIDQINAD